MKIIHIQHIKKHWSKKIWLMLFTVLLSSFHINAQVSISGNNEICLGSNETYSIVNPSPNIVYQWTSTSVLANVQTASATEAIVNWAEPGIYDLTASDGTNQYTYSVTVFDFSAPFITYDNEVGCQEMEEIDSELGNVIQPTNGCINVCEESIVNYTVNTMVQWYSNQATYNWEVTGGLITHINGTSITSSSQVNQPSGSNTYINITVEWGTVGSGSISVEEVYPGSACPSTTNTKCVNIIEKPTADFLFDNITSYNLDVCYDVCLNQEIYFNDLSVGSYNSQIISWEWDFGDNSDHSYEQNPVHAYSSGNNFDVTLTVTNECNCTDVITRKICVFDLPGPEIECPSVQCEGDIAVYSTTTVCQPYTWSITGGTISYQNPTDPEVFVLWDNVGTDGYGFIELDPSTCDDVCPFPTKIKIPVVLLNGQIEGPSTTCINESYFFSLPQWPATNYSWEIVNTTTNATFNSFDYNSHLVEIDVGTNQGGFTLNCTYENTLVVPGCTGIALSFDVGVKLKPEIETVPEVCIDLDATFALINAPTIFGSTQWTLTKPDNSSVLLSGGGQSITFSGIYFDVTGMYKIQASNPASFCDPDPVYFEVIDKPEMPTDIYGEDEICPNYPYEYTLPTIIPNTIVNWTVTGGTPTTFAGNSISVTWLQNQTTYEISATRSWEHLPICESDAFTKTISPITITGSISTSSTQFCEDFEYLFECITNVQGETYNWYITSGTQVGSISDGQGTANCKVAFLHIGAPASCTLNCEVAKCGQTETFSLPIQIESSTVIDQLTVSDDPICSGEELDIFISTSGATPDEYFIDFGDGNTETITTNSSTHTFHYTYNNLTNNNMWFTISAKVKSTCNGLYSDAVTYIVEVLPQPNVSLSPVLPSAFCPPYTLNETLDVSYNPGTLTFQWYYNDNIGGSDLFISGANTDSYTVTNSAYGLGLYWCVVTNVGLTPQCSTKTNVKLLEEDCPEPCTPEQPANVPIVVASLTSCTSASATATVAGTYGVPGANIINYFWTVDAPPGTYTANTTSVSLTQSPEYTFTDAGVYTIRLAVVYKNDNSNMPPCTYSGQASFLVPFVPDFKVGIACNPNNTTYDLKLSDNSSVFPGISTAYYWIDVVGGISSISTVNPWTQLALPAGETHEIIYLATNGAQYPACLTNKTITLPDLPVAAFDMLTTNPINPDESCEDREITFTNNSTPMANIISNVWDFDDGYYSHMENTSKTYSISPLLSFTYGPSLTVTDKYGCMDDASLPLEIFKNSMMYDLLSAYNVQGQTICLGEVLNTNIAPILSTPGATPYYYQWYNESILLAGYTNSPLAGVPPGSGAYWVEITDHNYCILNVNPNPSTVTVNLPPTAIIDAKADVCYFGDIELTAISGLDPGIATSNYVWEYTFLSSTSTLNGKDITISSPAVGIHEFVLTVTDPNTGCWQTSQPYLVEVHNLPPQPTVTANIIDCSTYEIELTANITNSSAYLFNWSNGETGSVINIHHGGAYRAWITDEHGCRSYGDKNIPYEPSYYFWRFPTGCYNFCPEDLPRQIDGPWSVSFEQWTWYYYNNVVTNNGNYNSTGIATPSEPLVIAEQSFGDGPGEYKWGLANEYCHQETDIMEWNVEECCELEMSGLEIECGADAYTYTFHFEVNLANCNTASFSVDVLDGQTYLTFATITSPLAPQLLNNGLNQVDGSFDLSFLSTIPQGVTIYITVLCEEHCHGTIYQFLPPPCDWWPSLSSAQSNVSGLTDQNVPMLSIMPNPARASVLVEYGFHVDSTSTGQPKYGLSVCDALGRQTQLVDLDGPTGKRYMDTRNWQPGIYFIEMRDGTAGVLTKRIVILK